jgi:hypothetical protein
MIKHPGPVGCPVHGVHVHCVSNPEVGAKKPSATCDANETLSLEMVLSCIQRSSI